MSNIQFTESVTINNIEVFSSSKMLEKINAGEPLFFTVNQSEIISFIKENAIIKDSGKKFEGTSAYFIPNSYIEIHVADLNPLDETCTVQVRKRADNRGVNFFVIKNNEESKKTTHSISITDDLIDCTELYNELHLLTKKLQKDISIMIKPKD